MKIIAYSLILTFFLIPIESANILGMFPSVTPSHLIIFMSVARTMIERGHNVTIVTTIPIPTSVGKGDNFRHIQLEIPSKIRAKVRDSTKGLVFDSNVADFLQLLEYSGLAQKEALKSDTFKEFLKEGHIFDLMLLGYFINDFALGVAAHFECPVAVITLADAAIWPLFESIGHAWPLGLTGYDFISRATRFIQRAIILYQQREFYQFYDELFPEQEYPSLDEMRNKISIILSNYHFSDGTITPYLPSVIQIGGIVPEMANGSGLPEHIGKFLDNSKDGAIFFSLGSTAKTSDLSPETVKLFFNVLSKLPQKILWKWDDEKTPGKSDNILFDKWLPQNDVLAHKNIQLFITHGGKGSAVESQYHGVPMVVIPLFGDQTFNAKEIEEKMYGISINHKTVTGEEFQEVVNEVLSNKKYLTNVKLFSELYKDRPISAKENAVFWMEYVIRHKGARHLQSPAVHMNFIQLHNLDVIMVVVLVLVLLKLVIWKVFSSCCSLAFRRKEKSKIE